MSSNHQALIEALQKNYRAEMEGAATYRALAEREKDAHRAGIIRQMAENEEQHAARWVGRLKEFGVAPAAGPFKAKSDIMLSAHVSSIDNALRKLEAGEDAMVAEYTRQAATLGDPATATIIDELLKDERRHSQSLQTMAGDARGPLSRLNSILRGEKHASTGSWIGDAIYGVNDGLGSVFGIVSGVSGATGGSHVVLLAGIAGMVASAVSMGSGAYLAAKSEGEVHQAELARERREINENLAEEKEELSLYYQLKGLSEEDARYLTERIAQDPERLLKVLAQEELGLSEDNAPNPWRAAITASVSTAVGAFVPIIPFFFLEGIKGIVLAAIISLIAHFAVGAAKSLITTRSWWASGLEMTVVGILAGTITYVVGVIAGPLAN
ncbi:MAG: VIT1/CCC1 transporter family protein [Aggregatilineales bacterium]